MNKQIYLLSAAAAFNLTYANNINLQDVNVNANLQDSSKYEIIKQGEFGSSSYTRKYLDMATSGDGTISEIIKRNPNSKISRGEKTSRNSGEIAPENISINAASFYQNNFLVDGVNINNDINPLGGILFVGEATNLTPFLKNPSQGLNLDTDLFENIEVNDSLVSAKYGNFQGGVINAQTKNPKAGFHGKISFRHTSDRLQKFHIAKENQEEFNYTTSPKYQPKFKKQKTSFLFDGYINENLGIIFNFSQIHSKILQQMYDKNFPDQSKVGQTRTLLRRNENLFLKGIWFVNDNLIIKPSIIYAPYKAEYYSMGGENAKADVEGGGLTTSLETSYDFSFGNLTQNFSYTINQMSRNTNTNKMLVWNKTQDNIGYTSEKTLTFVDGIGGDVEQKQEKLSYKADFKFNEFSLLKADHTLISGFSIEQTNATYNITKPYYNAVSLKNLGKFTCNPNDIFCLQKRPISQRYKNWTGQYFDKYNYFFGKTDADMTYFSFYIEDKVKIDNFTIRPGIRIDKNNYMGNWNLAPRISANLDVFSDDKTNIFGGYNRYYGRSIFAYKLKEKMDSLKSSYSRKDPNSIWKYDKTQYNKYNFKNLNVPYDDEFAIGLSQKISNFEISAKYLRREGKDLIRKSTAKAMGLALGDGKTLAKNYNLYTNAGKSKSNIYTIKLRTLNDLNLLDTKNSFEISYNYTDTNRNFNTYESIYDEFYDNANKVVYDGNLINSSKLPTNNNDTPWSVTATTATKFPNINLTWANFLTLQGGFKGVVRDGFAEITNKRYANYKSKKFNDTFVWDTKFTLDIPTTKKQKAYVSLEIYNLLNNDNAVDVDSKGVVDYDKGRQFWLEAGYKW